jgi:hypothetical protein
LVLHEFAIKRERSAKDSNPGRRYDMIKND